MSGDNRKVSIIVDGVFFDAREYQKEAALDFIDSYQNIIESKGVDNPHIKKTYKYYNGDIEFTLHFLRNDHAKIRKCHICNDQDLALVRTNGKISVLRIHGDSKIDKTIPLLEERFLPYSEETTTRMRKTRPWHYNDGDNPYNYVYDLKKEEWVHNVYT